MAQTMVQKRNWQTKVELKLKMMPQRKHHW
jgi:hypothetical protein